MPQLQHTRISQLMFISEKPISKVSNQVGRCNSLNTACPCFVDGWTVILPHAHNSTRHTSSPRRASTLSKRTFWAQSASIVRSHRRGVLRWCTRWRTLASTDVCCPSTAVICPSSRAGTFLRIFTSDRHRRLYSIPNLTSFVRLMCSKLLT